jgi:parallel beta-helix repeat protein
MKSIVLLLAAGILVGCAFLASATTLYVDVSNPAPVSPYTNWLTAATNIQDAVDASVDGDLVLVTNGVYATGGFLYGMTNRVAVTKPITVQSVNGPDVTAIVGYQVPVYRYGSSAIRGVYLTNRAVLSGFTVTNGVASSGGGVYCESTNAAVSNCVIVGNFAQSYGSGVTSGTLYNCTLVRNGGSSGGYSSTLNNCWLAGNVGREGGGANNCILNNCVLSGNSAYGASGGSGGDGGGAYNSTLRNCILVGNGAYYSDFFGGYGAGKGGGTYGGTLYNCILYSNTPGGNYYSGSFSYCCANPVHSGTGNIDVNPQLVSLSHLSATSPCHGAGSAAYTTGVDFDGEPWANPPSMGCDEYWGGPMTGALSVTMSASTNLIVAGSNVTFQAITYGPTTGTVWDFGDGTTVTNQPYISRAWVVGGDYNVTLRAYNDSNPDGVIASVTIHVVKEHYVCLDGTSPTWPYWSWQTAATNIQDAVDAAVRFAKEVVVSNGIYEAGARLAYGMTNRVVMTNGIILRSVNGPGVTIIRGNGLYGPQAIRCVAMASNCFLSGFTLTNGASTASYDTSSGGGVFCPNGVTTVSNCFIVGNTAAYGGGAYRGSLFDCTLSGNTARAGGGAYYSSIHSSVLSSNTATDSGGGAYLSILDGCTVSNNTAVGGGGMSLGSAFSCNIMGNRATGYGGGADGAHIAGSFLALNQAPVGGGMNSGSLSNCTVTGNRAGYAGGAASGTVWSSILYYNTAACSNNFGSGAALNYCCVTPLPPSGTGNMAVEPQLASLSHISAGSPCYRKGYFYVGGWVDDIDRESLWTQRPCIGCDEYISGSVTGAVTAAIQADYTNVVVGDELPLLAVISGRLSASCWDFGDGTVVSNRPYATHAWATAGDYPVTLRAYNESGGVSAMLTVHVVPEAVHFVSLSSAAPAAPYSSWATAATNIQDAVDAATTAGAMVLVSNGVYQSGGRAVYGTLSNRVVVAKPLVVQSLNGPEATSVMGYSLPGTTNGEGAVRCVYLGSGATLAGFTLSNGATRVSGDVWTEGSGGGVWCESSSAVVSNCVVVGNAASVYGGGVVGGTLRDCTLNGNRSGSSGGGAHVSTLTRCLVYGNAATNGGGVSYCWVENSTLSNNAASSGGGSYSGTLSNCRLSANTASSTAGASYAATLKNCTVVGNSAGSVGGCSTSALTNSIIYYNTNGDTSGGTGSYCCTPLSTAGVGNFTNPPPFLGLAGGDLHLQANSPCINAGGNAFAPGGTDLDGSARIIGGTVDVGAYECQTPALLDFYLWMQGYGLSTAASAVYANADNDRMNNWQEWVAGTDPTNAASVLVLAAPAAGADSVTLTWASVTNRSYYVERATSLAGQGAFSLLASNIAGLSGTTSYADTNGPVAAPAYYRVGVAP